MKAPRKKICFFALLSFLSIITFLVSGISLIIFAFTYNHLLGVQPYKFLNFIAKQLFWFSPVLAVCFGHVARHKIKKKHEFVKGNFLAISGIILGYFGLIIVFFILYVQSQLLICGGKKAEAHKIISGLKLALIQYKNDIGEFPAGSSKDVLNELTGYCCSPTKPDEKYKKNTKWSGPYFIARNIQFKNAQLNQELLDPWKKPYLFLFKDGKAVIWSSGPNRKNEKGEGDDIMFSFTD